MSEGKQEKVPFEEPLTFLVGRAGIEPAANGLKVRCSTSELTAHESIHLRKPASSS